ncbi:MAG: class I SAM-dependent methyltransferase [Bacillaceae bacterium]|nr:class I SAM-dependent methyltransferase [Bacillaceae bacterium]
MKFRESGMPDIELWDSFFDADFTLKELDVTSSITTLIDIGCGYGTFILAAAKLIKGEVIGIDIDHDTIKQARNEIQKHGLSKVQVLEGDITQEDFFDTLKEYHVKVDYVCLFNMLHCEEPEKLLKQAYQLLRLGGKLGVIHWIYADTPRGPSMDIRPKPAQIIEWCRNVNFHLEKEVDLPPYHYGQVYVK